MLINFVRSIIIYLKVYKIKYFETIDSTHKYIKEHASDLEDRTIAIADKQESGIGTHGRMWYTGDANNIAMSILIKPNCDVNKLNNITTEIAKAIQDAIKEKYNINLEIKYPNDLLLNNKKICGILTEVVTIKEIVKEIFIGIGFNVNEKEFLSDISDIATSLYKETKQVYCREDIICKILENIEQELEKRIF